jgi:hypothetical protein
MTRARPTATTNRWSEAKVTAGEGVEIDQKESHDDDHVEG